MGTNFNSDTLKNTDEKVCPKCGERLVKRNTGDYGPGEWVEWKQCVNKSCNYQE